MLHVKQTSMGLGNSTKRTRKREFLTQMERVVPWAALVELVSPFAPEGRRGRPPFSVPTMLRIHFMQQWFTLSDPAMEEALHDVPSSTKNASGERDREMHQSKKGNQWCFGMKTRIGVDAESGLVHTVRGTSGNVNDVVEGNALLHGQESEVFAGAGYHGAHKRADARDGVSGMRPCVRASAPRWTRPGARMS